MVYESLDSQAREHTHSRGLIVRRILPSSVIVGPSGRGTLTDLRHSSHTLEQIPDYEAARRAAFMAPEIRRGAPGDPSADVYTAGAILYYGITGQEPALDLSALVPPTLIRPAVPAIFDRLLPRALQPDPWKRYITAWEMYEDFTSEAGEVASQATFIGPPRPVGYADASLTLSMDTQPSLPRSRSVPSGRQAQTSPQVASSMM